MLSGTDILASSGLQVGDSIFSVDLDSVAIRIERLVWVRRAAVQRRPPDRLVVRIEERRRLAWLASGGDMYGIDVEGILLHPERQAGEQIRDLDLPVLSGFQAATSAVKNLGSERLSPGIAIADTCVLETLQWWREALAADSAFCRNISEITALDSDGLTLRLVADDLEVRVAAQGAAWQIRTLRNMMAHIYDDRVSPAYVDMRFAGQVIVGSRQTVIPAAESRWSSAILEEDANG